MARARHTAPFISKCLEQENECESEGRRMDILISLGPWHCFLRGEVSFMGIQESVASVMERHEPEPVTLESLLETDGWAREMFLEWKSGQT